MGPERRTEDIKGRHGLWPQGQSFKEGNMEQQKPKPGLAWVDSGRLRYFWAYTELGYDMYEVYPVNGNPVESIVLPRKKIYRFPVFLENNHDDNI
jgi:hypothetical protein